jgi:hypothetical protein
MGLPELLILLIGVGGSIFWIAMIVDCATKEPDVGNTKLVWIIIVVFTHVIGAFIYFCVRRPERMEELGR